MELIDVIVKNYDLDTITKVSKMELGSGNTFLIETGQNKYIVKTNERVDFINIYDRVQNELNLRNLVQSKIIRTNKNKVVTSEKVVLYEFIEGNCYSTLNDCQISNAIKYIKNYNAVLSTVPFSEYSLKSKNHWDKAKSVDFIISEFPKYLPQIHMDDEDKESIYDAIIILQRNKEKMAMQQKQLIHSDLGADNFVFRGDEVISIIDFTPEYNHEVYSLCQFIYWNYLWCNQNINKHEITGFLRTYSVQEAEDIEFFYLLLIKAILFRTIGPLLDLLNKKIKDLDGIKKRFMILNKLLTILN
jgi:Ser/Thr protein kinase RdoA (MazF antagonist)